MFSRENPNRIEEVKQLKQGVVGKQPKLKPGESFYYVSGTSLNSFSGEMSGKFLVRKYPNDDEPMEEATEESFLAQVGPFELVAPER